jgi:MoaA/NifB/PqqE/SkfB family radical SAM enzyme
LIMDRTVLKFRILIFILGHNLLSLFSFKMSPGRFIYTLRKQLFLSSMFKDAKYARVGSKYFVNPFAPYFPGRYFKRMLDNNSVMQYPLKPNYAQISVTNVCPCECYHCHVKNTQDRSADLSREKILEAIEDIIEADFPVMFFVGGEPMSRFNDLVDFIKCAKKRMDTRIFTSGVGVTTERLKILKEAGLEGICVSLDHYEEKIHNNQRKNSLAFKSACFTIKEASEMGFYVSAVCCTTGDMAKSGDYTKVVDLAESLGAHSVQINEIRPVGRANAGNNAGIFLTPEDKKTLIDYYIKQNKTSRKIAIVMPWYNEEPDKFGCMATSGQNVYINSAGIVQPCVLLDAGLGNINNMRFKEIWNSFIPLCEHPVRECIVHTLSDRINNSEIHPLPPEETLKLWPGFKKMEPIDMFKKIKVKTRD